MKIRTFSRSEKGSDFLFSSGMIIPARSRRLCGAVAPGWENDLHRLHRGRGCTGCDHGTAVRAGLSYLQRPTGLCGLDSEWRSGEIFENRNREPWVRRLREMPFQKQLERHFLSFDIRHLLSPKLLSDGTELLRHIRIGHCTGDIHCPSGFGGFIEPAFILHGLQRML